MPREHPTVRHDRARRLVVHEEVDEIDAVTHPLVGDAAREFPVETELEVQLRIERAVRLRHEPRFPVRILFAEFLHLRAAAPPRAVVVPHDLVLAHVAEGGTAQDLAGGQLIGFAAVLRAHLHDEATLPDGVARGFHVLQHVPHRLFAIGVFPSLDRRFQQQRVRVLRRRNQHGIDILEGEQLPGMLHRMRRAAVLACGARRGSLAIVLPEIADRDGLDAVLPLEPRGHHLQLAAAVADADMAESDPIVGAGDAAVGQGARGECRSGDHSDGLEE